MNAVLIALLVLPLLGAALTLAPVFGPDAGVADRRALRLNSVVTGAVFLLSVALAAGFDRGRPDWMQATTDVSWIPALHVRFHLGVDGVSLPLIVLTALLTFLCALYSEKRLPGGAARGGAPDEDRPSARAFVGLFLLLEVGMLATFAVLDLLLFFLAFEIVLIPMYFLIARWGSGARVPAANRFILYTLLGSAVMLLGFLLIGTRAGTFDMQALAAAHGSGLSHTTQVVAALAIMVGLAVKAPAWPLHSWLPDAHTAAPTVGSVLLAGVLLKMGTYGLVRVLLPVVPGGTATLAPYLGAFAAVGIVYGSLACLALALPSHSAPSGSGSKGDLKRLIAYSSVGHMGFVLLGIASLTPTGVNGALFANIAHGLITGLLFFLVGALKDRYGTADLDTLSGRTGAALYGRAPRIGALLAFAAVASLGLPGLAGFWGELLAMFGAFDPAAGLSRPAFVTYMVLAGLGTLLTAAYLLIVVKRVCMGDPEQPAPVAELADLHPYEAVSWTPLAALTLLAGLWPALLLGLSDPAVKHLLGGG
ncbi:complex I subunit 4 family protein [Kitasatospora sp. NPDC001660]